MKYLYTYLLGRTLFALFFLLTSLYCLLAYVPFTYQQVLKGRLIPALNGFAEIHPVLSVAMLAGALLLLSIDRKDSTRVSTLARRMRLAFLILLFAETGVLCWQRVLAHLENGAASYVWSVFVLVPVLLLGVLDWCELMPVVQWSAENVEQDSTLFRASCWTALFLTSLYGIAAYASRDGVSGLKAAPLAGLFAFGVSALTHLLAFMLFFTALNLLTVVASWFGKPPRAQFLSCQVAGAGLLWLVFRGIVFPGLAFHGWRADLYATLFAATAAVCWSGLCLRMHSRDGGEIRNGFAFAFWFLPRSLDPAPRTNRWKIPAAAALVAGSGAALAITTARMDWNFLLQKLAVLLIWVATFRLFYVAASRLPNQRNRTGIFLLAATGVLFGYRTLQATENYLWVLSKSKPSSTQFLETYAGYDVSFKLIYDAIAPGAGDGRFYQFLTQNTNIPRSRRIDPVAVNLVEHLAATPEKKPNIFLVVIDSLRRDYLSPYNRAVDFTPNIGRFAGDSVIMENAFTHYGGTGLSEPSIWVGGMMIHKQYVTPFAPMNSLQKLLETDGYLSFVSRDTILSTVVSPSPSLTELDQSTANMNYDLCSSLGELESKLQSQPASHPPFFAYTQPQNIHISVINREGARPIDNSNYRNFYAPYASRLRRMDACFGTFVSSLKKLGLYENSVVILTADHGDSLGEQGRWGHAYTIYPEILRVPLIVHLPVTLVQKVHANPRAIAFSTDITPSLYYMLGHGLTVNNQMFGRPIFTERAEEQLQYRRESYLVASSYGAVYGILGGDGKGLFVSDAVTFKDSWFDLTSDDTAGVTVSAPTKAKYQEEIRERIQGISHFYGYQGGGNFSQLLKDH
jgi:hypothetical protein